MTPLLAKSILVADAAANKCAPGLPAGFCHHHAETGCVAGNGLFCAGWAIDNFDDRYLGPFLRQLEIAAISVAIGFVIALSLALLSHRRRFLIPPMLAVTGVLYTLPSIAFFFLLLPITGLGFWTAVIPLSAYTLQIIYRNAIAGLEAVPADAKDAGRGMGMSDRELLFRVELPLATPEIVAGLRVAIVSTVAIATLASLAGAGGLGDPLFEQIQFKTNLIMVGVLAMAMALTLDLIVLLTQRFLTPWMRARPS
jgi:osmoprotectant transport system permease protein